VAVLLGDGSGGFGPPIFYHFDPSADNDLAVADLNGDGKLDVVIGGNGSSTNGVSVLLGNGAGSFAAVVPTAAPVFFSKIVLRDFDGDGKADLATSSENGVWVMFGDGTGSFGTAVQYATAGSFLSGLEAADFNGDGKTDLVTIRQDDLSVLLNDGHGQFSVVRTFPSSARPSRLVVGDFNVDGKADVVTGSSSGDTPNNISVLLGDGAGNLAAPINMPADSTNFLLSGDFNGDGKPDLVQGMGVGSLGILLGDGTGHFGAPGKFSPNGYSPAAVAGDFNEDGKLDVATNNITLAFGDGAGGLLAAPSFRVGHDPTSIATGDFNEDGRRDLVIANATGSTDNSVSLLIRNETGGYAPATTFAVGSQPKFIAVADFNGDHHLDFVTTNSLRSSAAPSAGKISVRLGDGAGNFGPLTQFPSGYLPTSLVVGDFNQDGKPDLVVANIGLWTVNEAGLFTFPPSVSILIGDGAGGFAAPQALNNASLNLITPGPPNIPEIQLSIAAGDLNNDSKLDLVVATGTTLSVLLGDGTGNFSAPIPYTAANTLNSVLVGDFNRDGKLDVATGSGAVSIRLGDGSGNVGSALNVDAAAGGVLAAGDFNSDNNLDLVVTSVGGGAIILGDGAGNFGTLFKVGGGSVAVDDLDGDGKLDIATTAPAAILLNTCGASVTPTPTPTPTVSPTPTPSPTVIPSPAPILLTEEGTNHALAVDSVTLTRGPFAIHTNLNFSSDQRTRILLVGLNVELLPGEDVSNITVKMGNTNLVVESVRNVPGFNWMTQLVVKLPDELEGAGDVQMSITLHGVTSNKGIVTIKAGP